jgi:anti-sigma regulatory factor (Ser/Thr protein kinase)
MSPDEPWSFRLFIPRDPQSVGIVRATLRSILEAGRLNCIVDTAELLVSELVTNAYHHANTDAFVSMDYAPTELCVSVWDAGPGLPTAATEPDTEAERGRGLPLVNALADAWGVARHHDEGAGVSGKGVWFRLRPEGGRG